MNTAQHTSMIAIALTTLVVAVRAPAQDQIAPPTNAAGAGAPQSKQTIPTGVVAVRAVQGTQGGPSIAGEDVELVLVHNGAVLSTRSATLDEHGVVLFEELPVAMGVTPVVRVNHAGVVFQTVGELMDARSTQQTVEVECYELTEEAPDWDVHMRHVLVNHGPEGASVTEILILRNPSDRTWVGKRDETGKGDTTSFTIPSGAQHVTLGSGFHGWCCTRLEGGHVVNTLPLMPSGAELSLSYMMPTIDGSATLHLESPTNVGRMMIAVPADVRLLNEGEFTPAGETRVADTNVRYFTRSGVPANETVHVRLAGLRDVPASSGGAAALASTSPASGGAPAERRASRGPMALLGAGAGALALIILGSTLFRTGRRKLPADAH